MWWWWGGGSWAPDALITPICIITHRCISRAMAVCFIFCFPTHGPCCLCSFSLSSCRGNGFRSENSVCVDFFFFYNRDAVGEGEREKKKSHAHTHTQTAPSSPLPRTEHKMPCASLLPHSNQQMSLIKKKCVHVNVH